VCDAPDAAAVVDRRLSFFPPFDQEPSISIELCTDGLHEAGERPSDGRIVHESQNVAIVYSDRIDELWVDYRGGAFAHCRPAEGQG